MVIGGGNRSVAAAAAAPTTTTTASKSVQVTVLSLTTPACPASTTASNRGRYAWPRTVAEGRVQAPCRANPHASAWRRCSPTGVWLEPDLAACSYLSEVTKVLEQFARTNLTFSKTSALESARRLKSYLNDVAPQLHDPHDALFVTQVPIPRQGINVATSCQRGRVEGAVFFTGRITLSNQSGRSWSGYGTRQWSRH